MAKKKLSSKSNYVPNRMINEIEVERNGKTTYIDGAKVLDGMYVKKGVKFGNGGGTAISSENGGYTVGTNADFSSNQYQPNTDFALMKRGGMLTWNGESFSAILKDAKENAEESKKEIKKIKGTIYNEDDLHSVAMGVKDDINDIYDLYDEDDSEWVDDDALQICYSIAEKMLASAGKKQKYAKGGGLKTKKGVSYKVIEFNSPMGKYKYVIDGVKIGGYKFSYVSDKKLSDTEIEKIASENKYAKGGGLKGTKYIPNYMVQSVEVERKGKTTDIDGADIYDGFYVKKGVKFATGGNITSDTFLKKEWKSYTKEARANALVEAGYSKNVAEDLSLEDWSSLEKKVQNGFRNSLLAEEIESMKGMMKSIYTYGSLEENSYEYDKYILPYKQTLGKKLFDKTFKEEHDNLKDYEIDHNVHTDAEGVTYNSLRKKKALGGFLAGVGVGVAGKWAYDKYGKKLQGKGTKKVASKGKKRKYGEGGEISNWGGTAESSQSGALIGGTNSELTSNQYGKGGGVGGGKVYVLSGYSAEANEYSYEEGELGFAGNWDEKESKTFSTKQELIDYINDKIIYTEYEESHFDWETGEGKNIQTDVLCSYDDYSGYYPADKKEGELWKKGKKKLYIVHYWIYVMAVVPTEYAEGGMMSNWSYSIGGL